MKLKKLLHPDSIALIGASANKEKLGWQILNNIRKQGFKGSLFPVSLKNKEIEGLKAYKDIRNIDSTPDLVIIVVPAPVVISEVEKCAQRGIKNIIIISAGFSEAGEEGKKREQDLGRLASENELNILGPNCLGLINSDKNINATFADFSLSATSETGLAFISQSGAVGSAFFDWSKKENIKINYFASLGNKTVLDENDFFEYFKQDKKVSAVVAYLEEIVDGRRFMAEVSRLVKIKPVVVLKSGMTQAGGKATMSHTGSLAGSRQAIEMGLRRSGAIVAENLEELFNIIKFLKIKEKKELKDKQSKKEGVCLVSNAGGPMVVSVDSLSQKGVELCSFSSDLKNSLKKSLPELTSYQNPLDVLGDAPASRYEKALKKVLDKNNSSYLLVLLTPQSSTEIEETARTIDRIASENKDRLIMTSFIGGSSVDKARQILRQSCEVADFDYPEQAITCLSKFLDHKEETRRLRPYKYPKKVSKTSLKKGLGHWDFLESLEFLKDYNISVVETKKINTSSDLGKLDYPLSLKRVGREIIHKTDEKGVVLNLKNKSEAKSAFKDLEKRFLKKGYCVAQPMIEDGLGLILGFKRDPSFGPVILVGWGGIYTEILKDVWTEADDICKTRAKRALKNLKLFPLIKGFRGDKGYDIESLVEALVNLGRLSRENPEIEELDINPVFVRKEGCLAVDVRILGS